MKNMSKQPGLLKLAAVLALAGLFISASLAHASVPNPNALGWDDITTVLSNRTLPLSWHDGAGRSLVYYHANFGTEFDAVELVKRARLSRVAIVDQDSLAYFSAFNGKEFLLRELMAGGVSPNLVLNEDSLLMIAARAGQLGIIRTLISNGANVNYHFPSTVYPGQYLDATSYALLAGKAEAARLLFSAGYDPLKSGPTHTTTLLFTAIAGASADAVSLLLENYKLIDSYNPQGETVLTFAIKAETSDAVVSELLLRGADPCKRNKANQSVKDVVKKINQGKQVYDERYTELLKEVSCRPVKRR